VVLLLALALSLDVKPPTYWEAIEKRHHFYLSIPTIKRIRVLRCKPAKNEDGSESSSVAICETEVTYNAVTTDPEPQKTDLPKSKLEDGQK
jgi:hypothetical protein